MVSKKLESIKASVFAVSGSPFQASSSYQDLQFSSMGAYASKRSFSRTTKLQAKASGGDGDGPKGGKEFFDFKVTKIDGKETTMKDLCGDKKASLIVNVASE